MSKKQKTNKTADQSFSLDSAVLVKAIDRLLNVVSGDGSTYCFDFGKSSALVAVRDSTYCRVDLDFSYKGKRIYLQDIAQLKSLVKGRGTVEFSVNKDTLCLKSGKYTGELKLAQMEDDLTETSLDSFAKKADRESSLKMDESFFQQVSRAAAMTRLTNPFEDGYVSTATVALTREGLSVVAFDNWHVHLLSAEVKTKTKPFKICIATNIFAIIDKLISGEAHFTIDSDSFIIRGDDVVAILPPIQDSQSEMAIELVNGLKKPMVSFTLSRKVESVLNNISGLLRDKDSAAIEFNITQKYLQVKFSSDSGSVSDKFPVENFKGSEQKVMLDPRVFYDTFKTVKNADTFTFSLYANSEGTPGLYRMEGKTKDGVITTVGYVGT